MDLPGVEYSHRLAGSRYQIRLPQEYGEQVAIATGGFQPKTQKCGILFLLRFQQSIHEFVTAVQGIVKGLMPQLVPGRVHDMNGVCCLAYINADENCVFQMFHLPSYKTEGRLKANALRHLRVDTLAMRIYICCRLHDNLLPKEYGNRQTTSGSKLNIRPGERTSLEVIRRDPTRRNRTSPQTAYKTIF